MWKPKFMSHFRLKRWRHGWCTWLDVHKRLEAVTSEMPGRSDRVHSMVLRTEAMARAEKETRRAEQVEFRLHKVTETM